MKVFKKIYAWFGRKVHSPYATQFLAAVGFIEAIIFIPVSPILMVYCLERRQSAFYYAAVATCASVAGGIGAYFIGCAIWASVGQWLVSLLFNPVHFEQAVTFYRTYPSWAILIAGFTPIPYKAITLSAGFCKLPLLPFVVSACIARGTRFFLLASIIVRWGDSIKLYIDRYFNLLVVLFTLLAISILWFIA